MKIIMVVAFFFLSGLAANTHAYTQYATNSQITPPTEPCRNCHSDGRTWEMFHNQYDSTNNRVHLPVIEVAGAYYAADLVMIQTQPTFRFRVENLQVSQQASQTMPSIPLTSPEYDSARVTYNAGSSQLAIPNITVASQNFSVTLTLIADLLPEIVFQF